MKRLALAGLILLFAACAHNVTIPPAGNDAAPTILINAFIVQQPSGYSGDVEPGKENVGTTTSVGVTEGARVMFSGSAKNPGGVQQFSVTVKQADKVLSQVTATGAPDSSGNVPDQLSIVGSNGAGGPGSQSIEVTMSAPVIVTATAANFHAMSQTITITYNPVPSSVIIGGGGGGPGGGGPTTASLFLTVDHLLGPFQTQTFPPDFCRATLTWTVTPLTLTGTTGLTTPFKNTVMANPAPSATYDAPSGLYTAHCPYGQMVGNLRTGTWNAAVSADGAGGSWQAQCQVTASPGMNVRRFLWGQPGCQ
ncbi:MAG: hypothetical protein HY282_13115 [Nitrospirae bacterium]|nr:hypothetical protein [Candidatus Manganitrophaceae bacterium]